MQDDNTGRDRIPEDFGFAEAAADFWNTHDTTDYEDLSEPVDLEVAIEREETLVALAPAVSRALENAAHQSGVSPETLVNLWLQERLAVECGTAR